MRHAPRSPWITLGLADPIGLAALVTVIGTRMPLPYAGESVHEFTSNPEQVWAALQDAEAHLATGKMMKSTEPLEPQDGRPTWREDVGHGEIITVNNNVMEAHP